MQMLLKCADIGHLAAAPANHRRWALCLEEEFLQQVTAHLARNIQFDIQFDIQFAKTSVNVAQGMCYGAGLDEFGYTSL